MVKIEYLSRKRDFARLSDEGKKRFFKFGTIIYLIKDNEDSSFRLGFAVSRKIGKAVVRNKIKRRLRAAINQELKNKELHCDMLFIAKKDALNYGFQEMRKHLQKFFIHITKEKEQKL